MSKGEITPKKHLPEGMKAPWKPGQSGNPAGRPKGARSKLGEAFVDALLADWQKNGVQAVIDMREERPGDYVKVIASLLPKELSGPDGDAIPVNTLAAGKLSEAALREIAALDATNPE